MKSEGAHQQILLASQYCLGPVPLVLRPSEVYQHKQGKAVATNASEKKKFDVLHAINCKDIS